MPCNSNFLRLSATRMFCCGSELKAGGKKLMHHAVVSSNVHTTAPNPPGIQERIKHGSKAILS